jgi:hypothetical protein
MGLNPSGWRSCDKSGRGEGEPVSPSTGTKSLERNGQDGILKKCRVMSGTIRPNRRRQQKVDPGRDGDNKRKIKTQQGSCKESRHENQNMPFKFDRALQSMHPFTASDLAFQRAPLEWHNGRRWLRNGLNPCYKEKHYSISGQLESTVGQCYRPQPIINNFLFAF